MGVGGVLLETAGVSCLCVSDGMILDVNVGAALCDDDRLVFACGGRERVGVGTGGVLLEAAGRVDLTVGATGVLLASLSTEGGDDTAFEDNDVVAAGAVLLTDAAGVVDDVCLSVDGVIVDVILEANAEGVWLARGEEIWDTEGSDACALAERHAVEKKKKGLADYAMVLF